MMNFILNEEERATVKLFTAKDRSATIDAMEAGLSMAAEEDVQLVMMQTLYKLENMSDDEFLKEVG